MNLEQQIESVLLFKNEPVTISSLSKQLGSTEEQVKLAVAALVEFYKTRGIVVVTDGVNVGFGTNAENSTLIESIQKEEFSRELGRAGLETLAVVLYKGPVSRREIDHIRGVSSGFTLRNLLIRGLIERTDSEAGERSYSYKPTLMLLEHLGVTRREELPEFETALRKVEQFQSAQEEEVTTEEQ